MPSDSSPAKTPPPTFAELKKQLPELDNIEGLEDSYKGLPPHGKNTVSEYVEIEVSKKDKPNYDKDKAEERMIKMFNMLEKRKAEDMGACVVL